MDKLIDQAGFAHARLPHQCHDLALTGPSLGQRPLHDVQLGLPPHEGREPARRRGLEAVPQRTRPHQVKDLHRLREPLDGDRPQGSDPDQALHQAQGRYGQADRPRGCELFHARRQVGGLPNGGVVHVQVVANRPDDDLPE